jgi:hypothetical protein
MGWLASTIAASAFASRPNRSLWPKAVCILDLS